MDVKTECEEWLHLTKRLKVLESGEAKMAKTLQEMNKLKVQLASCGEQGHQGSVFLLGNKTTCFENKQNLTPTNCVDAWRQEELDQCGDRFGSLVEPEHRAAGVFCEVVESGQDRHRQDGLLP